MGGNNLKLGHWKFWSGTRENENFEDGQTLGETVGSLSLEMLKT